MKHCLFILIALCIVCGCKSHPDAKRSAQNSISTFPAIGQTANDFEAALGTPTITNPHLAWEYFAAPFKIKAWFFKDFAVAIVYMKNANMTSQEVQTLLGLNSQGHSWRHDEQLGGEGAELNIWVLEDTPFVASQAKGLLHIQAARPGELYNPEEVYNTLKR